MTGILIDFGLAVTVAGLLVLVIHERSRFEKEFSRLRDKTYHQYDRFEHHHRLIAELQNGLHAAKGVAEKVKAIEERGAVTSEALYRLMKEVLQSGPGAAIRLDDKNRKIEIVPRKPSITDVDVKTPNPAQPCPKGPNE